VAGGGGTHSYLRELLTALPRRGRKVTVITRRTSTALAVRQVLSAEAVIVRVEIGEVSPIDKRLLDGLHEESLDAVRRAVLDSAPVRLLHSVYWNSGRVAMDLSRELGIAYVHTVISNGRRRSLVGAEMDGATRSAVEKQVFERASRIFCICPAERDDLVHLYGIDATKLVVVGRPVNLEFLVPSHDDLGRPTLLPPWNGSVVPDDNVASRTGAG